MHFKKPGLKIVFPLVTMWFSVVPFLAGKRVLVSAASIQAL